jgi:hypothetical protein
MKLAFLLIGSLAYGQNLVVNEFSEISSVGRAAFLDTSSRKASGRISGHERECAGPCSIRGSRSTIFRVSQVALVTSQALDLASNWSGPEANPLLATDGRMGWKGRSAKISFTAGAVLLQEAIGRKWPSSRRYMAWFNFGVAAPTAMVSIHNWRN